MVYVSDLVETGFFLITIAAILSLLCHWDFFSFRRRVGSKLGFSFSLSPFFFLLFAFSYQRLRRISFPGGTPTAQLLLSHWPRPHVSASIMLLVCFHPAILSFLSRSVQLEPYICLPLPSVSFRCLSLPLVAFHSWTSHSHTRRVRLAPPLDCDEREGEGGGAKS